MPDDDRRPASPRHSRLLLGGLKRGRDAAGGINPPRWSLESAIAYLDEARIDVAVASISTPGVHFGDDTAARSLAREVNEYLAGIKHDRPDRFGGFAALPLPDVEGSLEQIAYALDVLELDGVSIFTNAGGRYLGDDHFDPVFMECSGARQSCSSIPPRPLTRSRIPSGSLTRSSTTRSTHRARSPSSITATRSPARPTSSTCSSTPAGRFPSSPRASRSSTR